MGLLLSLFSPRFLRVEFGTGRVQLVKLVGNDIPDNLHTDAEVLVNQQISQCGDLAPFDPRCLLFYLIRESAGGLADDLEIANDGILRFFVRHEGFEIQTRHIGLYLTYGLLDVVEMLKPISRHRVFPARWPGEGVL